MAFDKLYQVLEASIEQEGSFSSFSDDLMAAIGNLRDESLKQAQKDSEKKKLKAQKKSAKEEQEQKEAEPPELEDEANQAKEPALGETELIQIGVLVLPKRHWTIKILLNRMSRRAVQKVDCW